MHVLFLAEDYTPLRQAQGGVLMSVARQVEGLAASGDTVTVLSPRRVFPLLARASSASQTTSASRGSGPTPSSPRG